ncbi:hypothetical protein [Serratia symbiotica]|uniref:hypothetical protein n=1 Tax=Serratia symbiotica TaxID=138074 RepID=UPI00132C2624|nr:hypothetical protein [Serratia symbiotica]QTP13409.1 hypothetical protein GPZ83_0000275 [Serratia symbiotica]
MSPSIREASHALIGAAVLQQRFTEVHGKTPPVSQILNSATGQGDSFRKLQVSIEKNGKEQSRLMNTLQHNSVNNQFIDAVTSIHKAAALARLTANDLPDSELAKNKVYDAIKDAFHKIEGSNSTRDVGDSLENTLREEITAAVGNETLSFSLLDTGERLYVEEVQASVFAAYDMDGPEQDNRGLDL